MNTSRPVSALAIGNVTALDTVRTTIRRKWYAVTAIRKIGAVGKVSRNAYKMPQSQ